MKKELRLIITRACNYNCYFCHGEGVEADCKSLLDSDDYLFLAKTCKKLFGWDTVTLTGGEPFVRADCKDIIEKLNNENIKITVVSNGELLDKYYDSMPMIERLNISIHSLDENKYSKVVQRQNKLKKVLYNLMELRNKNKKIDIRINTTIVKGLNDDEKSYDWLILLAKKLKASIKIIELFSTNKDEIVTLSEIQRTLFTKGFKLKEQDLFKNTLTDGETDIILSKIFCAMATDYYQPNTFCNANNDLFITPNGKIKMCRNNSTTIDILTEIKNRDADKLKYKFELANDMLGKACPFYFEKKMKNLAIDGGEAVMQPAEGRFVHPKVTNSLINAVTKQLKDTISIYDNSNIFKTFETNFKNYLHSKYALVTSSGTAAIWSLYDSIGLKIGDEVICPIYTFFATVSPILQTGATPVFVDCDENGNIDYTKIEEKITSNTKAIMVVHMWGYPAKMDKIRQIADKYDLYLFEDCSHAHGGSYMGKKLGEWGDASAFSLQGNKIITGGEGGVIVTNDKYIYKNALLLGHYNKRCKQEIDKSSLDYKYAVTGKGMKLRAHPLAISIANHLLNNLDEMNYYKKCYADMLDNCIKDIDGLSTIDYDRQSSPSFYAYIIKFDKNKFTVDREQFVEALYAEGCCEFDIPSSTTSLANFELFKNPGYFFPSYKKSLVECEYKNADKFANEIIKLPVWYDKEDWMIVYKYCEALKKVAKFYRR